MSYSRKYDFQAGTRISSGQVDEELNQLIAGLNTLESADTFIKGSAQMTKMTSDAGGVKLSTKSTADDILQLILAAGKGFHTFYAVSGSKNLPPTNKSIRGFAHVTDSAICYVYATDYLNNLFTNYYDTTSWKGWRHLVSNEDTQEELWSGGSFMQAGVTITPTKKLSECRNGWILVWSDFNSGTGPNNYDFHYSYVPKFIGTKYNGAGHLFSVPRTPDAVIVKNINVSNDKLLGDAANGSADDNDVVLRYVLEW